MKPTYAAMWLIRSVEERIIAEYPKAQIRCPTHLCMGQEAIAAGVCAHLRPTDLLFPSYRSHGWYLAKGGDLDKLVDELYGRSEGCSHGYGGSMHLIDTEAGVMGTSAIVGGMLPIAAGAALVQQAKGTDLSVVSFGDAAVEEGVFHETLNFASLHRLPLLFVCEHNGLAVNTPVEDRQAQPDIAKRAVGYGVPSVVADGTDVHVVLSATELAIERARSGQGPTVLVFLTNRLREHCGPKPQVGRLGPDPLESVGPLVTAEDREAIQQRIERAFAA